MPCRAGPHLFWDQLGWANAFLVIMSKSAPASFLFALVSLSACYGAAPPKPPLVPMPTLQRGARIDVDTVSKTTMESVAKTASSCPQGVGTGDPSCVVTHYSVMEPVTRTSSQMSYAGEPVTVAQFRVLTDPQYDQEVVALADLAHKCQRANVPRYVGIGMFAVGLLVPTLLGSHMPSAANEGVFWGGVVGGSASYALGYFSFGGRDCVRARELSNKIDMSGVMTATTVWGADEASELAALAAGFNADHAASARRTAAKEAEEVPAVAPAPARATKHVKKPAALRMR